MALVITSECIGCGACESVCPAGAISMKEDIFEINPKTCNQCKGHSNTPQCVEVCPTESCIKSS